jgi:hypothetical protein
MSLLQFRTRTTRINYFTIYSTKTKTKHIYWSKIIIVSAS